MNISTQKIKDTFIPDILTIKKFCNLTGWEYFWLLLVKQNFPRYWVCTGKQRLAKSFILSYFQQKLMKLFSGTILGLFPPYFRQKRTFLKSLLLSFFCVQISITMIVEKTSRFRETLVTNLSTYRWTDTRISTNSQVLSSRVCKKKSSKVRTIKHCKTFWIPQFQSYQRYQYSIHRPILRRKTTLLKEIIQITSFENKQAIFLIQFKWKFKIGKLPTYASLFKSSIKTPHISTYSITI